MEMHTTLHNEVGTIQALIASVSAGGLYKDTKGKKKKKKDVLRYVLCSVSILITLEVIKAESRSLER